MTSLSLFVSLVLVGTLVYPGNASPEPLGKPCSELEVGDYIILRDRPTRLTEVSSTGSRVSIVGEQVFTGERAEDTCPADHRYYRPEMVENEYQVIDYEGGMLDLMDDDGETFNLMVDRPVDANILEEIQEAVSSGDGDVYVTVLERQADGQQRPVSFRVEE
uniref:Uncharacterized protein n=1 Tax=Chromera velia CCMP2878 TaxID=1169474 RepID=A0A0G4G0A7_9ALVE|eukprot:Cvel_19516.t1-p1 / transcript=Cvel_19516.t1 / gene=Cvel_19516 / organism=Chromera_velia_CCMP2878 / gene_product=Eukaryotic translation initiation factor 5A-1, putative / transcript_product=Eukaryotic translation initiation factor 5A-1, putative / location=Cvel_scaffold1689:17247-18597(-) / protein_length=161 / sequence_SO=supercontig / SO=protein_coding / is_pseudo=false